MVKMMIMTHTISYNYKVVGVCSLSIHSLLFQQVRKPQGERERNMQESNKYFTLISSRPNRRLVIFQLARLNSERYRERDTVYYVIYILLRVSRLELTFKIQFLILVFASIKALVKSSDGLYHQFR